MRALTPEIMSPAGGWPQLEAAVEAGADAVYFGLKHFSARAKVGFSLTELPEVLRTLHQRGVAGYVTFNTLVFEHELDEAARLIGAIAESGADALIVQDYGVVRLARAIVPEMTLHASTQMSITDVHGVRLAASFGLRRATLARELSLDEIRRIRAATDVELEIFVHGALCVAYSGQCFSSEAWGGRSANRGQCAQACRLPYGLLVDDVERPLGDARYLLSPGDLMTLRQIPAIVSLGLAALKIEGRYKDAGYVALVTAAYRKAVDAAAAGRAAEPTAEELLRLEQVYSRGLGAHFITGTNHQAVVGGRAPRHRGVLMGTVARVERGRVFVTPSESHKIAPLKPGDGVVFDAAHWRSPEEPEEGGRLYGIAAAADGTLELQFANGALEFQRIREGDWLWRSDDPTLDRWTQAYLRPAAPMRRQAVRVRATAREGQALNTLWWLENQSDIRVYISSEEVPQPARNRGLDGESLREQFGRLGGTPYELSSVEFDCEHSTFLPAKELNRMRRRAVDALLALQAQPRRLAVHPAPPPPVARPAVAPAEAELHLLVRTPAQLDAALGLAPASITLDYLDLYGLRPSLERLRASGIEARVASPRILKPGEERLIDFLASLECTLLVRSAGLVDALRRVARADLIAPAEVRAQNTFDEPTAICSAPIEMDEVLEMPKHSIARLVLERKFRCC